MILTSMRDLSVDTRRYLDKKQKELTILLNLKESNATINKNAHITGNIIKLNQNNLDSAAIVFDFWPFFF